MKILLLLLAFALPVSAQVFVQGSKSAAWVPVSLFEYNGDGKPFHDRQYDAVPNASWYYQVDSVHHTF